MRLYEFRCPRGHITEERREISERDKPLICQCGLEAKRIFSPANYSFGWRLTESSFIKGNPQKLEPNI